MRTERAAVGLGLVLALSACSSPSRSPVGSSGGLAGQADTTGGTKSTAGSSAQPAGSAGTAPLGDGGAIGSGGTSGSSSEGGSTDAGEGGDTGGAFTADEVCREAVKAYCQRLDECSRGSSSCFARAELCPSYYFGQGSSMTPEGVKACIGELASWSCVDIQTNIPVPCLKPGQLTGGSACAFDSQCASEECKGGEQGCGTCTPQERELGQACGGGSEHQCVAGTFCATTGNCEAIGAVVHVGEGERCGMFDTPTVSCTGNLYCYYDSKKSDYFCVQKGADGKACGYDGATATEKVPCAHGLDCAIDYVAEPGATLGTCRQPRDCGDVTCDEGFYCDRIRNWECKPLPGLGQPCVQASAPGCAPGLICTVQPTYASTGTCLPPRAGLGDACDVYCNLWQRCESDRCVYLDAASCGPK